MKITVSFLAAAILLASFGFCGSAFFAPQAADPTVPFETGFVTSGDAALEYARYGDPAKETLVLIGGNKSDMHGMDGCLPYFAPYFSVLTVSNRATGNSTRGTGKLTFDVMAQDLCVVLDALGVEKAHLLGFSDGGNLTLVFAVNHPDRVLSIVPMSANINPFGTKLTKQIGICSNYFWKCVNAARTNDPEAKRLRDIQGLMVWEPKLRFRDLETIQAPALNIYGENDMMRRSHSRRITKSIPGARELMMTGVGHGVDWDQALPTIYEFYNSEFIIPNFTKKVNMKKHAILGVLLALLSGVCWGLSGTAGQYLFSHYGVDSGWLTCLRMLVAGATLTVVSLMKKNRTLPQLFHRKQDVLRLILFAVFGLMLSQFGYLQAIRYSNAGTATAIQYIGEAFVLIAVCIKAKRLPGLSELGGLALALAGVFLLASHGRLTSLSISPLGLLWGLLAAVALAVYTLVPGDLIPRFGNMTVTGAAMLIGGVVLTVLLRPWGRYVPLDLKGLGCLALVVVAGAIFSYSAYLQSVVFIGSVKAGLIAASETVAAPLFTLLWLGTTFVWADYLGFACIAAMVVLLALPGLKTQK